MKRLLGMIVCLSMLLPCAPALAGEPETVPGPYTLVLLRHGESVWNKEDRFTGWSDVALTEKGMAGALMAGQQLKAAGLVFDEVHTSCLNRAIKTAWLALEGMNQMWLPVFIDWRLNERSYGDLEGKTREEVKAASGEEQVKIWRRSFDVPPPPLSYDDPRSPAHDPRYKSLDRKLIPQAESLKDVIARSDPYWKEALIPTLRTGRTVLVVGHSTALRALSSCIDPSLDEKALQKLEIPNSTPIVYTLDASMKPIKRVVLEQEKTK